MPRDIVHHLAAAHTPTLAGHEPRSTRPVRPGLVERARAAWARRRSVPPDPAGAAISRWAGVDGDELLELRRYLSVCSVPQGAVLTAEGTCGREFFVLCSGRVTVSIEGEPKAVLTAEDHFGELALLRGFPGPAGIRRATVQALTDCTLAVANPSEFASLLHEYPELAKRIRARSQTFTTLEELQEIVTTADTSDLDGSDATRRRVATV